MAVADKIKKFFRSFRKEKEVLKGNESKDKIYASRRKFINAAEAAEHFSIAKKRLYDVNGWSYIPSFATARFELFDASGKHSLAEIPEVNFYIKVLLPGPLPENWVKIISILETDHMAEFTVSPSENPNTSEQRTEHFFKSKATSTFRVALKNNVLSAYEVGRNEEINSSDEAGNRKILNTMIAEGGWAGFQKFQWKKLTEYLIS